MLTGMASVSAQDEGIVEKVKDRRPQLSADAANAAIRERNWIIGATFGNLGFNFEADNYIINVNPRAGYFLSDNAALGTEIQLNYTIRDGDNVFQYGFVPFVRYYFPEGASDRSRWFGEAILGFGGSDLPGDEDDSAFDVIYGLRGGYAHFVGENVALEAILGYVESDAAVSIGAGQTGLNFAVGLQVYLPSKMNANATE